MLTAWAALLTSLLPRYGPLLTPLMLSVTTSLATRPTPPLSPPCQDDGFGYAPQHDNYFPSYEQGWQPLLAPLALDNHLPTPSPSLVIAPLALPWYDTHTMPCSLDVAPEPSDSDCMAAPEDPFQGTT